MVGYMRLRQICLVAPQLEPVISDIAGIMDLNVCYRDGNVAKYGLENALMPVDTILSRGSGAVPAGHRGGRFLTKPAAAAAIWRFCCDDPDARAQANAMGCGRRT